MIYAWCDNGLKEHSLNTANTIIKVSKLRNMIKTLSLKLNYLIDGRFELRDYIYELLLLTAALHDTGKACRKYQENVKWGEGTCSANFKYHEIISGAIFAEALSLVHNDIDDKLKYVMTLAVFNHHYALRQLDIMCSDIERFIVEIRKVAGDFLEEGIDVIKDVYRGLRFKNSITDLFVSSFEDINISNIEEYIKDILASLLCRHGYSFIIKFLENEELNYMASVLTGVVNISDTITAYCERWGCGKNRFAEHLLSELGVLCSDIISSKG